MVNKQQLCCLYIDCHMHIISRKSLRADSSKYIPDTKNITVTPKKKI